MTGRGIPYAVPVGNAGESTSGAAAAPGRVRRAFSDLAKRPLRQLATWAAGVALLLTAPFGGWADAAKPALATAEAKQVIHTGPLDITIERISSSTRPSKAFTALEDGQYLMVFGTVKSTQPTTLDNGELAEVVRLVGVDGLQKSNLDSRPVPVGESTTAKPLGYYVVDSTMMFEVPPLMTFEVAWVWQRTGSVTPPASVQVEIEKLTFRESSLEDSFEWLDPAPMAHLRLPVTVKDPYVDPKPAS